MDRHRRTGQRGKTGGPPVLPDPHVHAQHTGAHRQHAAGKAELHRVLQAIQCSSEFGVYVCESFRDPRRQYIDDYWQDVCREAIGIEEMHRLVGKVNDTPLPDDTRVRFHQFARLLERLARRIDRVVLD